MTRKTLFVFYSFLLLCVIFAMEIFYLKNQKEASEYAVAAKKEFVLIVGLPDLAISTEATYIRHKSLSDFFSIYKDDPTLRDYFVSSFAFSESKSQNEN